MGRKRKKANRMRDAAAGYGVTEVPARDPKGAIPVTADQRILVCGEAAGVRTLPAG